MAKLERLAQEIETIAVGKREMNQPSDYSTLLSHVRNDAFDQEQLAQELEAHQLRFFANKLRSGYYDQVEEIKKVEKEVKKYGRRKNSV